MAGLGDFFKVRILLAAVVVLIVQALLGSMINDFVSFGFLGLGIGSILLVHAAIWVAEWLASWMKIKQ